MTDSTTHKLLSKQLEKINAANAEPNWDQFVRLVNEAYHEADRDRRRTDRSISLMVDEQDQLNAKLAQTIERLVEAQRLGKIGDWTYKLGDENLWWAPEVYELLGRDPKSFQLKLDNVKGLLEGDGAERLLAAQREAANVRHAVGVDVKIRHGDGRTRDYFITSNPKFDPNQRISGFVGTLQDISERKHAEEQLQQLAYYDPLTGLANRSLFGRKLKDAIKHCAKNGGQGALLLLDLDRFKEVNDSLGHVAGDELLAQISHIIANQLPKGHFLARLGGDEFAVIVPSFSDVREVEDIAAMILTSVEGSLKLSAGEAHIGTSIGVGLFPEHGLDPDELQRNADLALYRAKEDGRGRCVIFSPDMSEAMLNKVALVRDLRHAIASNRGLEVHYQAQVEVTTGRVTGFEALTRWNHPTRGYVSPLEFIPVAESSSLIVDLGLWVLRESAMQAKAWLDAGEHSREVAVNVSAAQIWHSDLVRDVAAILEEIRLPPQLLCLELTESLFANHSEDRVREAVYALKSQGVSLALDDFGTGYSSLGYLTQLPFDKLKIDRVFVDGIATNLQRQKVLKGIVALGKGLGLRIVAEGAEKPAELKILKDFGCELVQGFIFARPAVAQMALAMANDIEARGGEPFHGDWREKIA